MLGSLIKEFEGSKIVITGASGFIGGRLTQILSHGKNIKIKALVHNYSNAVRIARFPVDVMRCDITSKNQLGEVFKDADYVFHCAYGNNGDKVRQKQINVEGTQNVLMSCKEAKVRKVIYLSTMAVYGMFSEGNITEQNKYVYSRNIYSDSKINAENVAVDFYQKYSLPISILQPAIVYGPWAPTFTLYPINLMLNGQMLIPSNEGVCNSLYIDDLMQALLLAASNEKAVGERYLISGKDPVSWSTFYSNYAELMEGEVIQIEEYDKIIKLLKENKKRLKTSRQILNLLRSDAAVEFMLKLPIIKSPYEVIRPIFSDQKRKSLRRKLTSYENNDVDILEKKRIPILEDESEYKARTLKTYIDINKAKSHLGYNPQFLLDQGMEITKKWITWTNLI